MSNCIVEFSPEVKDKGYSVSKQLMGSVVKNNNGAPSKLWSVLRSSIPQVRNMEDAFKIYAEFITMDTKHIKKYPGTGEPILKFQSDKKNIFDTYKEALQDSNIDSNILVGVIDESITDNSRFIEVGKFSTQEDLSSREGLVNHFIRNDVASSVIYNKDGQAVLMPEGDTETERLFNSALMKDQLVGKTPDIRHKSYFEGFIMEDVVKHTGVKNDDGNFITVEEAVKNYEDFANRTSFENAARTAVNYFYTNGDIQAIYDKFPNLNVESNKDLSEKLFSLIRDNGIRLMSIEEYQKRYSEIHGKEMDAIALADIANGIIALSENATLADVAEEVSHFLVEAVHPDVLNDLLYDEQLENSPEYAEEHVTYYKIYSEQGYKDEALETKVRKEILGKILANKVIGDFNNRSENNSFWSKVKNHIKEIIDKFKALLPNNKSKFDEVIQSLSDKILNDRMQEIFNIQEVKDKGAKMINPVFYSSKNIKREIARMDDLIRSLESRMSKLRKNNVLDFQQYQFEVSHLQELIDQSNYQQSVIQIAGIAESMTENLQQLQNESKKGKIINVENLSSEHIFLEKQVIPLLQDISDNMENFQFTDKVKDNLKKVILDIENKYNIIKRDYSKTIRNNSRGILKELADKYGISDYAIPQMLIAIEERIEDISWFAHYFGNPEHSNNPFINFLGKLLSRNDQVANLNADRKTYELREAAEKSGYTQEDSFNLVELDEDGNDTGNIVSWRKIGQKTKDYKKAQLESLNKIVHGSDTSSYVDYDTFDRQGLSVFNMDETQQKQWLSEKTKIDEVFLENRYVPEIVNKNKAIHEKLGISEQALQYMRQLSSQRHRLMKEVFDKDGNIDLDKFEQNRMIFDKINQLISQKQARTNLVDSITGETFGTINENKTETVEIVYKDNNGVEVKEIYEIPIIEFNSTFDPTNIDHQVKADLVKMNLFNRVRFEKEKRTINAKYSKVINDIEDSVAKSAGFKNYQDLVSSRNDPRYESTIVEINNKIRQFLELSGGFQLNNDFYDNISDGPSANDRLNELKNKYQNEDDIVEKINNILNLRQKRNVILKRFRSNLNSVETDASKMTDFDKESIDDLDKEIKLAERDLKNHIDDDITSELKDDFSSYEPNSSFYSEQKRSGKNIIEFTVSKTKDPLLHRNIRKNFDDALSNPAMANYQIRQFLIDKGYITEKDFKITAEGQALKNNKEAFDKEMVSYLSRFLPSYYTRFVPKGYDSFMKGVKEGVYLDKNGNNVSLGDFVRNQIKKQEGSKIRGNQDVEQYFDIKPSLQFTDGDKSYDETLNPNYEQDSVFGNRQFKFEDEWNEEFFKLHPEINQTEFKSLPSENARYEYLEKLAQTKPRIKVYTEIMKVNMDANEIYGMTNTRNAFNRGIKRKDNIESLASLGNTEYIKNMWERFKGSDIEQQDEGAVNNNIGLSEGFMTIPKRGIHRLENDADMSRDVIASTMFLAQESAKYQVRNETLQDGFNLKNLVENQITNQGVRGKNTFAYKQFENIFNAHFYGITKTESYIIDLAGQEIDLVRIGHNIFNTIGRINTAFSPAVAATAATSGALFGSTDSISARIYTAKDYAKAMAESSKTMIESTKQVGKANRTDKMFLTMKALGLDGYDNAKNYEMFGRNRLSRKIISEPGYAMADALTEGNRHNYTIVALMSTKLYNGKWLNKEQYENIRFREGANKTEVSKEWDNLKHNLYDNYQVDNRGGINVTEKGRALALEQLKQLNPNETDSDLEALLDNDDQLFRGIGSKLQSIQSRFEGTVANSQKSMASRHIIGKALLINRNWWINFMQGMFKATSYNHLTGQYEKGMLSELPDFKMLIKGDFGALSKYQETMLQQMLDNGVTQEEVDALRKNFEMMNVRILKQQAGSLALFGLLTMIGSLLLESLSTTPEDRDDFLLQSMLYLYVRTVVEYGSSQSVTGLVSSTDIIKNPTMVLSPLSDMMKAIRESGQTYEQGNYKGYNKLFAFGLKYSPLRHYFANKDPFEAMKSYLFFNEQVHLGALTPKSLKQRIKEAKENGESVSELLERHYEGVR